MAIGGTLLIVSILLIAVWVVFEMKRFRHKIFAIFLIALILFTYLSFLAVLKGKSIDLGTASGLKEAGKLYVTWLGSVFSNLKSITTHAVDLDWKSANSTLS